MAVGRRPARTRQPRRGAPADAKMACRFLINSYDEGAAAEALLRAFLSERNCNPTGAQFWIEVYELIAAAFRLSRSGRGVRAPQARG